MNESRRPQNEHETNINWFFNDTMVKIWTSDYRMIRTLEKRGWKRVKEHHDGVFFEIPKRALTFRSRDSLEKKKESSFKRTPENMQRLRDQLAKARKKKRGENHGKENGVD